jgi:SAM-dependent methyltransferase
MNDSGTGASSDEIGERTLASIAAADAFNHWMYTGIRPFLKSPVLEVGSGIGNISAFCISDGHTIFLSDLRKEYCDTLANKFASEKNIIGIAPIDLTAESFESKYVNHLGKYKSIFALNVIEHIEDDTKAMRNLKKMLEPEGIVAILVPAYPWLFSRFDTELGHYRRYTSKTLNSLLERGGFAVNESFYFNAVGILGWFIFGKVLKRKQIREGQMKLYNALVPVIKIIDAVLLRKIGLSVVAIGKSQ